MTALAMLLAAILCVIAAVHLYWAAGGVWPGTDEKSCARAIAGFKGINKMPTAMQSVAVAAALVLAALLAIGLSGASAVPAPGGILFLAGIVASLVFVGRGVAAYTPAWRRLTPEMPFARYDKHYYGPLCLIIGAGFVILSARGLSA